MDDLSNSIDDDLIRQQTDLFAAVLFFAAAASSDDADDDVDSGWQRQISSSEDMMEGRLQYDKPAGERLVLRSSYSTTSSSQGNSSLTPEQLRECKEVASKLDMVAIEINEKYNIAQQKLKSASSYADFDSAIVEVLRSGDPTANQVALLVQLTRDAAAASWRSASDLLTWSKQYFQQRIAKQMVQDHQSLKSCVEEAVATRSQPTSPMTS